MTRLNLLRGAIPLLLAASLSAACISANDVPTTARDGSISRELLEKNTERFGREHDIAGLAVAIGSTEGPTVVAHYGHADLELDVGVTAGTRFRTASVSKWFTSVAALKLAEAGKLDLDAPIQQYCPAFPEKRWPFTARHLLTHTAGIRHYVTLNGENPTTEAGRRELRRRDREELQYAYHHFDDTVSALDTFKSEPLLFRPGSRQHYTSHGYRVLGCVLRGAAGVPYNAAMTQLVFEPATMPKTTMDDTTRLIEGRASGYRRGEDNGRIPARYSDLSGNAPAGGHLSTPLDLVNFGLHLLDPALFPSQARSLMRSKPQFPALDDDERRILVGPKTTSYYAYGVMVVQQDDSELWYHTGAQDGARSLLAVLPSSSLAIAIMSNDEVITRKQLTGLATWIIRATTGKRFDLTLD